MLPRGEDRPTFALKEYILGKGATSSITIENEVKICRQLRVASRYFVTIVDWTHSTDPTPSIVFECLDFDLLKGIRENFFGGRRQVLIMQDVLDAYTALHKLGIVHRDAKPDNVLIWFDEDHLPRAKIGDYGLAISRTETDVRMKDARQDHTPGIALYRSPEVWSYHIQVRDFRKWPYDKQVEYRDVCFSPAVDIWGVGCTFAE